MHKPISITSVLTIFNTYLSTSYICDMEVICLSFYLFRENDFASAFSSFKQTNKLRM